MNDLFGFSVPLVSPLGPGAGDQEVWRGPVRLALENRRRPGARVEQTEQPAEGEVVERPGPTEWSGVYEGEGVITMALEPEPGLALTVSVDASLLGGYTATSDTLTMVASIDLDGSTVTHSVWRGPSASNGTVSLGVSSLATGDVSKPCGALRLAVVNGPTFFGVRHQSGHGKSYGRTVLDVRGWRLTIDQQEHAGQEDRGHVVTQVMLVTRGR